ncbi:nucleotide-diphospho-sugar transferase [Truncatella angustata]|uniref:Nucleotide-diphospho-sugar transferase n=1 Tax=Truncatella angustata TaxID=152316 RepID=A0A9P8UZH7_9PEZI|nr:nucleotide-diphospho-sugar transferase [Truncatella angustata]KAH6661057.1 nucleotide-diphospho-sugar transferase [Truncatella angustata]
MSWSLTLRLLATSALAVVAGFLTITLPYLFFGAFTFPVIGFEVNPTVAFLALFFFRYWRLLVHIISFCLYKPVSRAVNPRYTAMDVTVICPTIEPFGDVFRRCIESVCSQHPAAFYIVVGGAGLIATAEKTCVDLRLKYPHVDIQVHASSEPGKRKQVDTVIPRIRTAITLSIDDHVFWPVQKPFLPSVLAPFEDPNIALVGTNKRVLVKLNQSWWITFWNMIGALYLERHNFEIAASSWIDGGVFTVSGRTYAVRSEILKNPEFRERYLHEMFLRWGPIMPDDDNFLTRFIYEKEREIRIQFEPESLVETTLGWYPKHIYTSFRWARTTFRSNPKSLMMRKIWAHQPWSIYAVYISGMTNFALPTDILLCYLYDRSLLNSGWHSTRFIVGFIVLSKLVKTAPYFRRYPLHLVMFPGYLLFAWSHSFIKLYALLTINDGAWSGRSTYELLGTAHIRNSSY